MEEGDKFNVKKKAHNKNFFQASPKKVSFHICTDNFSASFYVPAWSMMTELSY